MKKQVFDTDRNLLEQINENEESNVFYKLLEPDATLMSSGGIPTKVDPAEVEFDKV